VTRPDPAPNPGPNDPLIRDPETRFHLWYEACAGNYLSDAPVSLINLLITRGSQGTAPLKYFEIYDFCSLILILKYFKLQDVQKRRKRVVTKCRYSENSPTLHILEITSRA